jgi:hypothetical protein
MVATPALFEEPEMTDTRNDEREGYCDGIAGRKTPQPGRSAAYVAAWRDGVVDHAALADLEASRANP